jgi:putative transcriptional regulator
VKNNIKIFRQKFNWTQEYLANKINVSRQTIISIESERYVPSTILALKISKVFEVTVEEIFFLI